MTRPDRSHRCSTKGVTAAAGAFLFAALSACTGDGSSDAGSGAATPPGDDLPTVPALDGAQSAAGDFRLEGPCRTEPGQQHVHGRLVPSVGTKDYVVVVNWVDGASVVGRAVKVVEEAEKNEPVTLDLTAQVSRKADACTLDVRRGRTD